MRISFTPSPVQMHCSVTRPRISRPNLVKTMAVKTGEKAPDFSLKDQNGKTVKLSSNFGVFGKPVILYFYPKDNTPGCTTQAKAFKDAYTELSKKLNAKVIGISSDSVDSHQSFCDQLDLPFTLLSDEGGEVRSLYKVPKDLFGLLDGRVTFVVDKTGTVVKVFNSQFAPEKHVTEAINALAAKVAA